MMQILFKPQITQIFSQFLNTNKTHFIHQPCQGLKP